MKTDQELKLKLIKLLPYKLRISGSDIIYIYWMTRPYHQLYDTEWLHVCHLIEQTLTSQELVNYANELAIICGSHLEMFATWQQRATALLKIKGIE